MALRLYNTMTRRVDEFEPIEAGKVRLYTCGLTVYNYAHIGNLRTYVFEDILRRVLTWCGYTVRHVMNVTDVGHLVSDADEGEDKMEVGSAREGRSAWEIAEFYWDAFRRDMQRLHLLEPDVWCRATDHIPEQIEMVRKLQAKGYTYLIEGNGVYFDTSKLSDYGKLARLDVEGLQAGARIEMVAGKRHPTDFALWKFSPSDKKRQMEWDSPWGVGFPGWHIECSAMAIRHLGERLDIHCGAVDHVNVHHTNEIAQAEAALGHKWCNWWIHGEWLVISRDEGGEGEKMAKSAGEFVTLQTLIDRGFDPLAYRYFCLGAHYRQQLAFTWEALAAAANAFSRLKRSVLDLRPHYQAGQGPIARYVEEFRAAAEDDLNMPRGLAAMWNALRDTAADKGEIYATLLAMDPVLGFDFQTMLEARPQTAVSAGDISGKHTGPVQQIAQGIDEKANRLKALLQDIRSQLGNIHLSQEALLDNLLTEVDRIKRDLLERRLAAKRLKEFQIADQIRDSLLSAGEQVSDLPDGSTTSTSDIVLPAFSLEPDEDGDQS